MSFIKSTFPWEPASNSQVSKELKALQAELLKKTTYSVKVKYNTYDSQINQNIVKDNSYGYIIKQNNNTISNLLGIYTVQNKDYRVTIDSAKKIIHVANVFKTEVPLFSISDYEKILKFCKAVKKYSKNNLLGYRFETTNKEGVLAQEIILENNIIKEANVFYCNEYTWRENNTIKKQKYYPRLQVQFFDFNDKITLNDKSFEVNNIIQTNNKKISLTSSYKSFKLIDGRIKK